MENKDSKNSDFLFNNSKQILYKKGQLILRVEDAISGVYYIKKGYVRQFLISKEGKELTTSIFKPLDIFPLFWIVGEDVSNYNFEALTSVEILRAPREKILEHLRYNPDFFFKLISRLINRLDAFNERIKYMVFNNAGTKVASMLVLLADRFGKKKKGGIFIQVPLTHKDIASLLGITRETVSVEMKKLEDKGIYVCRKHYILIKKNNLLKKAALLN